MKMSMKIEKYHYTACGLDNIYIQGLVQEDDAGEEIVTIPKVQQLHRFIAEDIIKMPITGKEIRFLRTEMGLTVSGLSSLLSECETTVRDWESDKSSMDSITEHYFRILSISKLGLPKKELEEVIVWSRASKKNIQLQAPTEKSNLYKRVA